MTEKIIFKFFAMACSYTTYVLDTDPTFIIQIRICITVINAY